MGDGVPWRPEWGSGIGNSLGWIWDSLSPSNLLGALKDLFGTVFWELFGVAVWGSLVFLGPASAKHSGENLMNDVLLVDDHDKLISRDVWASMTDGKMGRLG